MRGKEERGEIERTERPQQATLPSTEHGAGQVNVKDESKQGNGAVVMGCSRGKEEEGGSASRPTEGREGQRREGKERLVCLWEYHK